MTENAFAKSMGYVLKKAEHLLLGPESLKFENRSFWGWRYLMLRHEKMPGIDGIIETRTAFANPADTEQKLVIVRKASWNAKKEKQKLLQTLRYSDEVLIVEPEIQIVYSCAGITWLNNTENRFDELCIPIKLPQKANECDSLHYLYLARQDGTLFNLSWGNNMSGVFTLLDQVWQATWDEMNNYSQQDLDFSKTAFTEHW